MCVLANEDYFPNPTELSFFGSETHTINISLNNDNRIEGNESFVGQLLISPDNVSYPYLALNNSTANIIILDDGE